MNKKYLITFLMLLLYSGLSLAQEDPRTVLYVDIDKTLEHLKYDSKEWDGTSKVNCSENYYILKNQNEIDDEDEVVFNYEINYTDYSDLDNPQLETEPNSGYYIWCYLSLTGKDAYKYKLEVTDDVKRAICMSVMPDLFMLDPNPPISFLEPYLIDVIKYDENHQIIKMLESIGGEITKRKVTLTPPTENSFTYGNSLIGTDIKATLSDPNAPGSIKYVKNNGPIDNQMLVAGEQQTITIRFVPEDEAHYENIQQQVNITVTPKTISHNGKLTISGKIKDGTVSVKQDQILKLPELQGVVSVDGKIDDVKLTVDYNKTKYPNAEPGIYDVDVYLSLTGSKAGNYILENPVIKTKLEIVSDKREVVFDGGFVILPKYYDESNKMYNGEVIPPTIKNLDEGDQVEVIVDYTQSHFVDAEIGEYELNYIVFSLGGVDAYKYKLTNHSTHEPGEIKAKPTTIAFNTTATGDAYQLFYTHSQLGTDLKMSNLEHEQITDKYFFENKDITNQMLTEGTYLVKASLCQFGNEIINKEIKVKVLPLKLEVSEPEILHTKAYDGNNTVILSGNKCVLTNKLASDNVEIASQTQVYDSPEIGSGKIITVSFELSGDLTGKYIAPDPIIYNDGAITPGKIEIANITVLKSEYCQGDEAKVKITISNGLPESATITFDGVAKQNGFADIDISKLTVESATERSFELTIPQDANGGVYNGEIVLKDALGTESQKQHFEITVNFPNKYIKSKFTDVVFISNAEDLFAEYQWYKDGNKLDGETMQFYNDPNGVKGFYSADVVTTEGKQFKVCGVQLNAVDIAETKALVKRGEIYPNPAKASQPINVKLVNFNEDELSSATMFIFNSLGNKVLQRGHLSEEFTIELPKGSYTVSIISNQQRLSYKIIVND
ncbi:MAG: T9SS type A sorting domain-containing protein [Bacteroidales bacterium]|nr:T9SS type A sorting domain-containing protein [Bacteroidales bacterium]